MSKPLVGAAYGRVPAADSKSQVGAPIGRGDFPRAVFHGSTPHFRVYYQPALGSAGAEVAEGVLAACESDFAKLKAWFGGITPSSFPFNVIIAKLEGGGSYHYGCAGVDIYCDVRLTPSVDPLYTEFLNISEIVEVFGAAYGAGWGCKRSKGEGLSRVLAAQLYPSELGEFATAHYWLDGARPDFVNATAPTDTNPVANGCSVLFLNYLHVQLGYSWRAIIRAGGANLKQTWVRLVKPVGNPNPFKRFKALLNEQFPSGTPSGLADDNPWPIKSGAPKPASPAAAPSTSSAPVATPSLAFSPALGNAEGPTEMIASTQAASAHLLAQPPSPRAPQKRFGLVFRPPERQRPLAPLPQKQPKLPQPPKSPHPAAHSERHRPVIAKLPAKSPGVRHKHPPSNAKSPPKARRESPPLAKKHAVPTRHAPPSTRGSGSSRASGGKPKPKH
jgi:hypothetical protein